jgi:hypothetical protein
MAKTFHSMVVALQVFQLELELCIELDGVVNFANTKIDGMSPAHECTRVQSGRDHESRKTDQNNCNAKQQRSGTT